MRWWKRGEWVQIEKGEHAGRSGTVLEANYLLRGEHEERIMVLLDVPPHGAVAVYAHDVRPKE